MNREGAGEVIANILQLEGMETNRAKTESMGIRGTGIDSRIHVLPEARRSNYRYMQSNE